jgi:hypothetical protein
VYISDNNNNQTSNSTNDIPIINKSSTTQTNSGTTPDVPIPESGIIEVPFTTQAPFANWDALHEEACEEASLIMLKHFVEKTTISSPDQAEQEIQGLIAYETSNGYKQDVTVQELAEIARKDYGLTAKVKTGITITDIKQEIANGNPVIIPAAGKLLPNPNFRNGGPLYHMLVVKGFDKDGFITNDPGTRKGENFRYTYDALYNAIHNWNESDIMSGEKAYLIITK